MNLPNKITILRIIMIPIFMIFIIPLSIMYPDVKVIGIDLYSLIAALVFILAAATDGIDGYIARKNDLVTNFGKFLDPIADKLLITGALLALIERGDVSSWFVMIILAREFIVTAFRLIAASEGIVIAASKLGKLKTVFQIVAVAMLILKGWPLTLLNSNLYLVTDIIMIIAVLITLISGVEYIVKNAKVLKN